MKDSGEFLRKASLARAALAALERHDLAPEPQNYALFYAYASGSEPLLKEAIDGILREEGGLSRADLSMLCRAFLRDQALGLTWHELPFEAAGPASTPPDATASAAAALAAAHAAATRIGNRSGTPGTPALVTTLSGITSMQFGLTGVVMAKNDGSLWGYGASDDYGQLPQAPTKVDDDVRQFAAGQGYYIWQRGDGTFWGRGYNPQGAIGLPSVGTTTNRKVSWDLSMIAQ